MGKLGAQIFKHSFIYGFGDVLRKCIGFLLIPLYTHYLNVADYGVLELLDLLSYLIALVLAMGISDAVLRYYFEFEEEEKKQQVIANAFLVLGISICLGLTCLYPFTAQLSALVFQSSEYSRFIDIVLLTLAIELINELCLSLLRIRQQSILFSVVSLVKLTLNLLLNILFIVVFEQGILGILYSALISSSLSACFLLFYTLRKTSLSTSLPILKQMLIYGAPLIFTWFSMFVINFGDRFLLQRYSTLSEVGLYSLAYKFGMLPQLLIYAPFMRFWSVKRFEIMNEKNAGATYRNVFTYFCLIETYLALGIAVLIYDIVKIISPIEYHAAASYVPILLAAYVLNGIYDQLGIGLLIKKQTKKVALFALMTAALNLCLNLVLIPLYGAWGAACTTLFSYGFFSILMHCASQRVFHISYDNKRLAILFSVALLIFAISQLFSLESPYLGILLKGTLAALLPLALLLLGFFTKEEIQLARKTIKRFVK